MKKIITVAMIIVAAMSFAQMEISRNRLDAGAEFEYTMRDKHATMGFTVPAVSYEFEALPSEMFRMYLYGDAGFNMSKWGYDGEWDDEFSKVFGINLAPMGKVYLPNDLFVKFGLPFMFANYAYGDNDAVSVMGLDMFAHFGYDNRELYLQGMTPWGRFEKGMAFYGVFDMGIMYSEDGDSVDDLPMHFGVEGCYAHYNDGMMIKPYLSYMMQLNEDAGAKDAHLNIGAVYAQDFTEQLNLEAGLNYSMVMPEDSDVDGASDFEIGALVNYYVMPELNIFGGFGYWMDMTKDNDSDPMITIKVGAAYTLDFLK